MAVILLNIGPRGDGSVVEFRTGCFINNGEMDENVTGKEFIIRQLIFDHAVE